MLNEKDREELYIMAGMWFPGKISNHDNAIEWKHFLCYWPFVRGILRSKGNIKSQWDIVDNMYNFA